jgi:hypothetical protein
MKITIFCPVAPCSQVDSYQCFGGTCCFHLYSSILKMKAGSSFETLVTIYLTIRCHILEYSDLHGQCHKSLKSHVLVQSSALCFFFRKRLV